MTTYQEVTQPLAQHKTTSKFGTPPRPILQAVAGGVSRSDDGRLDVKFSAPESPELVPTQSSCLRWLVGLFH